jgi:hypothetical protein
MQRIVTTATDAAVAANTDVATRSRFSFFQRLRR